ncbi:MAG: TIGR03087 family PEP-CTERM/XrtA system glycosyltransferase [Halorhodospira sp.]
MAEILLLVHRLPWPPNKGDKIRSYHILRHLAAHHRVHLGTFVDDPGDWRFLPELEAICASVCARPLPRWRAQLRALSGFLSGEPLTLPWYRDRCLALWARAICETRPLHAAIGFSSSMGQYLPDTTSAPLRVVDFVDIDSEKWRQYAQHRRGPMRAIFTREARRLLAYERRLAASSDVSLFVSAEEVAAFRRLAPESAGNVLTMSNGVDTDYFDPAAVGASPYAASERPVVLTGAMDYWPNVDAACWFAEEVLPQLRGMEPAVHFYVVGSRPAPAVAALASRPGVTVTGFVADIRPWIRHAAVAVAPLRVARGIQNKVLEAMALGRPVVASPEALEGLQVALGAEVESAEAQPGPMVEAVCRCLARSEGMGAAARRRVVQDYSWTRHLGQLDRLLSGAVAANEDSEGHALVEV